MNIRCYIYKWFMQKLVHSNWKENYALNLHTTFEMILNKPWLNYLNSLESGY